MLEARPAVPTDAERIAALLDRCSLRHQGVARSSIEDALERLTSHGADPARDSALVLRDGAAVGFAHSWKAAPGDRKCFARVDPDATGAGVGTLLLERMEARARSGTRLSVTNWAGDVAGPPLLEGRGYETVRHFLTMGCDLAGRGGSPAPWPEGIRVRTLEDDDRTALVAAYRAAFADNWEPSDVDDETWWEDRSEAFDPSLWFLAVSVSRASRSAASAATQATSATSASCRPRAGAVSATRSSTTRSASSGAAASRGPR